MWQSVKVPFLTIIFALLSLFIFTKIFGPIPFSVNSITTNKQNLFTVTGTAEVTAIPDTAMISLGVNKESPTVEAAKEEVNKIINKITQDLKNLGVDEKDIKTTNFSVNPKYDYRDGNQKENGFTVNANIEVKLDSVEKANNAIDIATKDGATLVGNVQFVLDEDKKREFEKKARKEAIAKAKEKAGDIARDAGIKLGRIVDVQENGGGAEPRPYYGLMSDTKQASVEEPTQLSPGENKVISTVSLSYETY
ncbi:MAG TPA: SIMPL domain-containing protein [Candidatus Limnocylindrales bacterium]|nr:SIMPL domain-containing protein [Candidatus Limnocylindrales bacterium]